MSIAVVARSGMTRPYRAQTLRCFRASIRPLARARLELPFGAHQSAKQDDAPLSGGGMLCQKPERKKYPTANRALGRTRDALDVVNQLLIPVVDDVVGRHYSAAFLVSSGNRSRTNSRTTCAEERASSATSWLGQKEAS